MLEAWGNEIQGWCPHSSSGFKLCGVQKKLSKTMNHMLNSACEVSANISTASHEGPQQILIG